jgi:hypothetical protein
MSTGASLKAAPTKTPGSPSQTRLGRAHGPLADDPGEPAVQSELDPGRAHPDRHLNRHTPRRSLSRDESEVAVVATLEAAAAEARNVERVTVAQMFDAYLEVGVQRGKAPKTTLEYRRYATDIAALRVGPTLRPIELGGIPIT